MKPLATFIMMILIIAAFFMFAYYLVWSGYLLHKNGKIPDDIIGGLLQTGILMGLVIWFLL